ncbi:hypothetical protein BH11PSE11_BH11PSE11_05030 [soil metagenome]
MSEINKDAAAAQADMLGRALDALERVQNQLERDRAASNEPLAVVGIGCRFPGADGANAFAAFLDRGGDAVREVPAQRAARFAGLESPSLRQGGFFEDVAGFDASLFGLSDEEAIAMDPHQRLLLEVAWQALEDAGEAGGSLAGTCTGVYLGLGAQNSDYAWWLLNDQRALDKHAIAGSFHSLMPGRLSYLLDLRGPSMVVDAACASGLVSVHLACQALRRRECDAALAAAVNLILSPLVSLAVQRSGLWSGQGHCRAFDSEADGFVRGEGCGVLVLKRLSDAFADGDAIRAVIHGSAVGQDGRSNGLTAPNGPAQEAVMRRALAQSGIAASQVAYVEAHATGTLLGDAIEAEALGAVYGAGRVAPLLVGALKPNLGHLEAASGMAGLIKTILSIEHGRIAPTLHHARLNPDIHAARSRVDIVLGSTTWPQGERFAGVSAFGMSGTNAHMIVGPAPVLADQAACGPESCVLRLGANDEASLRQLAGRIAAALTPSIQWPAVCASLNSGRKKFATQFEIKADTIATARDLLLQAAAGLLPLAAPDSSPLAIASIEKSRLRKVRLPTYPFRHTHYWPASSPESAQVPSTIASQADAVDIDGMLSQLQWQRAPLATNESKGGRSLLLAGSAALAQSVLAELEANGPVARAVEAPADQARWKQVLDAAPEHDLIYFCTPASDGADQLDHATRRALTLGGLLALVKAMAEEPVPRRLFVVAAGAWEGDAESAMAISLGRSVALEHPDLRCRCIDIDVELAASALRFGQVLVRELAATDGEEWVRQNLADRLVPRVLPLRLPQQPFIAKPAACYLISGGFGGIGCQLAGWLVERGARDLMLIGRTVRELPQAAQWMAQGVRIRAVAADVADHAAITAAVANLVTEGVQLAGVFHTAGIQDDALLYRHAWPDFAEVLRAKVDGARVLRSATRDATRAQPLDMFVLFSSVSALCGLTGAAAYAAANAALGALARRWRAEGVPALSVMWGSWEGSGMVTDGSAQLAKHWEALGIQPFAPVKGTAALEALMAANLSEAIAADLDWEKLARWARAEGAGTKLYQDFAWESAAIAQTSSPATHHATFQSTFQGTAQSPGFEQPPTPSTVPAASTPPADAPASSTAILDEAGLQAIVRESVAKVLGKSVNDPALDLPFGELGLNSLAAIELRSQLSARLGIAVPATVAFNHPSVYAVVKFLGKRMALASGSQARENSSNNVPELSDAAVEFSSTTEVDQPRKRFP